MVASYNHVARFVFYSAKFTVPTGFLFTALVVYKVVIRKVIQEFPGKGFRCNRGNGHTEVFHNLCLARFNTDFWKTKNVDKKMLNDVLCMGNVMLILILVNEIWGKKLHNKYSLYCFQHLLFLMQRNSEI